MSTINERRSRRAVGTILLKKCTVGLAILSTQAPKIHATSTGDHKSPQKHQKVTKTINNNFGQQHRKGESNNKRVLEETYMPTLIPTIAPTSIIDDTEQPSPAPMSMLPATPNPTASIRPTPAPMMTATTPAPMSSSGTTSNNPEPPTPKWSFNPYTIQPISVSKPSAQQSGGNVNSYCGSNWSDAWKNCPKACPGGQDAECTSLGEGYKCQDYTGCYEKVGGSIPPPAPTPPAPTPPAPTPPEPTPPVPASTISPTPKPTGQPVKPVEPIAFPACVPEYATGADYSFGALVSYPTSDGSGIVEVYECQGDLCNAGPTHAPGGDNGHLTWTLIGTCTPSSTTTEPTLPGGGENGVVCPGASVADPNARWWLRNENGTPECICGVSYGDRYDMTNPDLVERFIFMSETQCCDRYPNVCDPSLGVPVTTLSPSVASGGSTSPAPTMVTASPDGSTDIPTTLPTYAADDDYALDDDSSAFVKGQGFILGAVTVAIALFL